MGRIWKVLFGVVLIVVAVVVWFWDGQPPSVDLQCAVQLGRASEISLVIEDPGKGLSGFDVIVRSGQAEKVVHSETFPPAALPWQQGWVRSEATLKVSELAASVPLADGPFEVEVRATDHANLWFFDRQTVVQKGLVFDSKPPQVRVLSSQHYLRQGGSEAVLYKVLEEGCLSGVEVGDKVFRGFPVKGQPGVSVGLFAMAYNQPVDVPVYVWAEDAAGNRARVGFHCEMKAQPFRQRKIDITESFVNRVAPEILSNSSEISEKGSLLETFLEINDRLRQLNTSRIEEITSQSADSLLWQEPFLQLSKSKVEAFFADHRFYYYEGKQCDEQTHLGFDLASTAHSPVEASNSGQVVLAEYLGIYGNTVILDHGLGLFSLYGHMSSLAVEPGQVVSRGEILGNTGQTGLAGGDHLHFSMVVQGVQVNPLEWWDPSWVRLHLLAKIGTESAGD